MGDMSIGLVTLIGPKIHFMNFVGALSKMQTMAQNPVRYALDIGDDILVMNELLGHKLNLTFTNKHICFCGLEVESVYRANFCYACYFSKPEAGEAIFRPELSKAHLGEADRDLEFEKRYQLQPHVVYLANSGGLKVGVTRARQKQTRWMDQGATHTIVLAETENRYQAGLIEVALKDHISDKTNWRKMLSNQFEEIDLLAQKKQLAAFLPSELQSFISPDNTEYHFTYPLLDYPQKIKSVNLGTSQTAEGKLAGIKGQYLIFENVTVLNVRSHEAYVVELAVS